MTLKVTVTLKDTDCEIKSRDTLTVKKMFRNEFRGGAGLVCVHGNDEEGIYFMFYMNKYRKDEVFEQTLNTPNNFQTCRTVRDSLSRSKIKQGKKLCKVNFLSLSNSLKSQY